MRGHNGVMIDVDLARRLRDAGLRWHPRPGDRFTIEQGDFDSAEVFTISDMTVEAHDYPTGTVLGFNGTTEWALDSVAATDALWLPREDSCVTCSAGRSSRWCVDTPRAPEARGTTRPSPTRSAPGLPAARPGRTPRVIWPGPPTTPTRSRCCRSSRRRCVSTDPRPIQPLSAWSTP